MRRRLEVHFGEYFCDRVVPMMRGATEAVERLVEEPEFVFVVGGVADRWVYDHALVIRESGIAEGVFAVALLEDAAVADGLGSEKAERAVFEDWCISLGLVVVSVLVVAEDDDAWGLPSLSGLTTKTHMDGMALGMTPCRRSCKYVFLLILVKTCRDSNPPFSSL